MEKLSAFTHSLDLALRLVDTTSGRNISGLGMTVRLDGSPVAFHEKADNVLIFMGLKTRSFRLELSGRQYETVDLDVDLDRLDKMLPMLEIHLIPSDNYLGTSKFFTLKGCLPGIEALSAVRAGENHCVIREFEPRKRMMKLFNPHHLGLERVFYALVDPDRNVFEPMRILRMVDDQTAKIDHLLEMPFRNYFPIVPQVLGLCRPDGSYCLRVRDDGDQARWIVRWKVNGTEMFRLLDFRNNPDPKLEEEVGK